VSPRAWIVLALLCVVALVVIEWTLVTSKHVP
jgi:hypothetical protein